MNKKKILIASVSFYPRISPRSFRATEIAKEFAKQGHSVTVLTDMQNFDYTEFRKTHNIEILDFAKERWPEIKGAGLVGKLIRFILNYFILYPDIKLAFLLRNKLATLRGFDLLISIAVPYPVHWGVALSNNSNNNLFNTWIADCGDPFMGNKETKLGHPFYFHFVEKWFCKKPNFLTVPIKEAIGAFPQICRHKIRVIPQGFNFEEVRISGQTVQNSYPHFSYAGLLSRDIRDPSEFLEYLCSMTNLKFRFIVYTRNIDLIQPFKNRLGDKLEIRDYIPREILLKELARMDFLVNIENINNVQSPSKLIDYALIGKPILSISPNRFKAFIVDEFLNGNYTNQFIVPDLEIYNIKNVASQFLKLSN